MQEDASTHARRIVALPHHFRDSRQGFAQHDPGEVHSHGDGKKVGVVEGLLDRRGGIRHQVRTHQRSPATQDDGRLRPVAPATSPTTSAPNSAAGPGSNDPGHPREEGRFAKHADGRVERPFQAVSKIAILCVMSRLNLTLSDATIKALRRHAGGRPTAKVVREMIEEVLERRARSERLHQLARDYASGREDALELLADFEPLSAEVLNEKFD